MADEITGMFQEVIHAAKEYAEAMEQLAEEFHKTEKEFVEGWVAVMDASEKAGAGRQLDVSELPGTEGIEPLPPPHN
jgi:hypothetical protein